MLYWQLEHEGAVHRLINGDCAAGLDFDETVYDVVVTSPPYNVGTGYRTYNDSVNRFDYLDWCHGWMKLVALRLSENGSFFLNIGGVPSSPLGPFEIMQVARQYFKLQNVIVWVKSIAVPGGGHGVPEVVHGHYQPINSPRFLNACHEFIFHLTKTGEVPLDRLSIGVPYKDAANIARWKGAGRLHCRGNTWFLPYDTIQAKEKDRPHPASFPLSLPTTCIKLHGIDKTGHVLDLFGGIGTTSLACAKLGVNSTVYEIDPGFLATARERLVNALGRSPADYAALAFSMQKKA